jgi:phage-related protein
MRRRVVTTNVSERPLRYLIAPDMSTEKGARQRATDATGLVAIMKIP